MARLGCIVGLGLALAGCGPRVAPAPVADERFTVQLEGSFATVQSAGPSIPVPGPFTESWTLDLLIVPLEAHPDDSITRRWTIVAAVDAAGAALPLTGRVFDVRQFPSGELLQLGHVGRAVGPGYGMEAWDLLFFAVSPKVPAVGRQPVRGTTGWTTPFGLGRSQRLIHSAIWALAPLAPGDPPGALAVTWADPVALEGRGTDRGVDPAPEVRWDGRGGEGRVVLARDGGALLSHRLRLERQATLRFPGAPGGPVELQQDHAVEIRVERR
jgi:hypothetical protein